MSSTGSVLRWPSAEEVLLLRRSLRLEQTRVWAQREAAANPDLEAVGVFGSYGRGDAGVGSDLDCAGWWGILQPLALDDPVDALS